VSVPSRETLRKDVREYLHSESEVIVDVGRETESGLGFGPRTQEFLRKIGAICPCREQSSSTQHEG